MKVDPAVHAIAQNLYIDHYHWLFSWLRRKLSCPEQAADLVQDTFVRIIGSRDLLFGMQSPRAFLTATARNLMIDRVRRQQLEAAYLDYLAQMEDIYPSTSVSAEYLYEVLEALDLVAQALSHLSSKAQQAFILHYLEGERQSDIAIRLGVSDRMVRKYLVQAMTLCCEVGEV